MRCPWTISLGHMVEPEEWKPRSCNRTRFHLGQHDVGDGFVFGRWWVWDHPAMRLSNWRSKFLMRALIVLGGRRRQRDLLESARLMVDVKKHIAQGRRHAPEKGTGSHHD